MSSISNESRCMIEKSISQGSKIPEHLLRLLSTHDKLRYVQLSKKLGKTEFPGQLRRHYLSSSSVAKKSRAHKKQKAQATIPHKTPTIRPKAKKKGNPTSLVSYGLPKAKRPPPEPSASSKQFIYIGGDGSLPVQNDKAANLPYES